MNRVGQCYANSSHGQLLAFVAQLPACRVAMEARASAHYWAREIEQLGHRVRLVNPRFVKPYVKAHQNDASDAEAIGEAAGRPSMRLVPLKTAGQLEVQALHRVSQQLVKSRTTLINQVRGLLADYHMLFVPIPLLDFGCYPN
jgi:transposase